MSNSPAGQLRLAQRPPAAYGVTDLTPEFMLSSSASTTGLADSANVALVHQSITSSGRVLRAWLRYQVTTSIPGGRRLAVRLSGLSGPEVDSGRFAGTVHLNNAGGTSDFAYSLVRSGFGGDVLLLIGVTEDVATMPILGVDDTIDVRAELLLTKEI